MHRKLNVCICIVSDITATIKETLRGTVIKINSIDNL